MGAYSNEELPLPPVSDFSNTRLSKHVHDNVHGNIYLDPVPLLPLSLCNYYFFHFLNFFSLDCSSL